LFFFSGRRRHTRSKRDWSSDVCSSDLRSKRPGTENLIGAVGFHKAAQIAVEQRSANVEKYQGFKDLFLSVLKEKEVQFEVNGALDLQLPNIVNISFSGIP